MKKALILTCLAGLAPLAAAPAPDPRPAKAAPAKAAPAEAVQAVLDAARAEEKAVMAARKAHVDAGKNTKDFKGDCGVALAANAQALEKEKRPQVRQALLVARTFLLSLAKEKPDADLRARLRKDVPPTSAAWSLDPGLLSSLAEDDPAFVPYVAKARDGHADPDVRRPLLLDHFWEALDARDERAWKASFETLQTTFKDSREAAKAREVLEADRKTALGTQAPALSLPSLEDPAVPLSLEALKGRYVLVDFWATWCPPCRAEMPWLHKAWETFHPKGLEMLSLSFDRRKEHIAPFRQNLATPMPWRHAYVEGGFANPLSRAWGVQGIPKPVLVGPDGKVVAVGAELHGARLLETLARFLK